MEEGCGGGEVGFEVPLKLPSRIIDLASEYTGLGLRKQVGHLKGIKAIGVTEFTYRGS